MKYLFGARTFKEQKFFEASKNVGSSQEVHKKL